LKSSESLDKSLNISQAIQQLKSDLMHKQDELLSNIVENSKHSIDQRESVQDLNNKVN